MIRLIYCVDCSRDFSLDCYRGTVQIDLFPVLLIRHRRCNLHLSFHRALKKFCFREIIGISLYTVRLSVLQDKTDILKIIQFQQRLQFLKRLFFVSIDLRPVLARNPLKKSHLVIDLIHQDPAVPLRRALQDFLCLLPYRSSDSSIIEDHNDTKQKTKKKQAKRCRQISIFGFISVFRILMFFLHFFSLLSYVLKMKKNPALQDSPPAAGRTSDIFHSAAVRSSRSVFIS